MAVIVHDYFSPGWRASEAHCVCGWRGDSTAMPMSLHQAVTDYPVPPARAHC